MYWYYHVPVVLLLFISFGDGNEKCSSYDRIIECRNIDTIKELSSETEAVTWGHVKVVNEVGAVFTITGKDC